MSQTLSHFDQSSLKVREKEFQFIFFIFCSSIYRDQTKRDQHRFRFFYSTKSVSLETQKLHFDLKTYSETMITIGTQKMTVVD